jgi:DNA-binding transcriptional ArsR family regulator
MDQKVARLATHLAFADRLKALAHPARLEILRVLAERGTCICGAVVEVLPLAQSTVSQHLKVLKEAGFIRGELEGPSSCYCLDPVTIDAFHEEIDSFLKRVNGTQSKRPRRKS